jgi:hypothetical protein
LRTHSVSPASAQKPQNAAFNVVPKNRVQSIDEKAMQLLQPPFLLAMPSSYPDRVIATELKDTLRSIMRMADG